VSKVVATPRLSLSIIRTTAEAVAALLPDMTATSPVVLEYLQFVLRLVEKIVVHPEGQRGTSIEVHGRLASLLATVKAWEDEEKRLRSIWMRRFIAERKAGALARSEEKLQFLELMNRESRMPLEVDSRYLDANKRAAKSRNTRERLLLRCNSRPG
jgi:hypothetical protein